MGSAVSLGSYPFKIFHLIFTQVTVVKVAPFLGILTLKSDHNAYFFTYGIMCSYIIQVFQICKIWSALASDLNTNVSKTGNSISSAKRPH